MLFDFAATSIGDHLEPGKRPPVGLSQPTPSSGLPSVEPPSPSPDAPSAGEGFSVLQDAALDQSEDDGVLKGGGDFARECAVRLCLIHDQALAAVPMRRETKGNLALLLGQALYPNEFHSGLIAQGGA
ncbi:hypothetical protein ACWGLL_00225 [Brevundimonas sp. NPDC055814]